MEDSDFIDFINASGAGEVIASVWKTEELGAVPSGSTTKNKCRQERIYDYKKKVRYW